MADLLTGKRVVLGVTGSIAAYKAVSLASALTQAAALVDVIMTREAMELVRPLSFQAITHRPVVHDMFQMLAETEIGHVSLGRAADAVLVAPATAHTIARLAHGLADDMLTTTILATSAPVIVAPAMDAGMYDHPTVRENVAKLRSLGYTIVEPEHGYLASGLSGQGRLADQAVLLGTLRQALGRNGDLRGWRVLVTAGGTQEPIDPVRYISNRSSGKMGFAIAEAARDRGAEVILVSAPASLHHPIGVLVVQVQTADEMCRAVLDEYPRLDALIMAAAVADYRPAMPADSKIKKDGSTRSLDLVPTPDILEATMACGGGSRPAIRVGFAAETDRVTENAREKLERKKLDLIVANDVSREDSGFGTDTNLVTLFRGDGSERALPLMLKRDVADVLMDEIVALHRTTALHAPIG